MDKQDTIFFRNFSITVGILAAMMAIFLITARAVANFSKPDVIDTVAIEERTEPVGQLVTEETQETAAATTTTAATSTAEAAGAADGESIYSGRCVTCHGGAIPGIPALGDATAWADRIAKGKDILYANAINGYTEGSSGMPMPPKGGFPDLSDDQFRAAVDYMVENSQ